MKNSSDYNTPISIPFRSLTDVIPADNKISIHTMPFTHHFESLHRAEIMFITSYPPRECGIATYSQDLINAIDTKFGKSIKISVCALETTDEKHEYDTIIQEIFDTSDPSSYVATANHINQNEKIKAVVIQHEFGFYTLNGGSNFLKFIQSIEAPVVIVFHTVLPNPDERLRNMIKTMAKACHTIIVMTNTSKSILDSDYQIESSKIEVIAHGTHLVYNNNKSFLKKKYGLTGRRILSTFGLLSSGKGIETTLDALPEIVKKYPDILFLIIGKTHPVVVKSEGEKYREMLNQKIGELQLENNVQFINEYLELEILLEYLRLTDIYLFTSKDPNQAVSGTFSYAMSCGCPIISTPIPQARELLDAETGIIFGFNQSSELAAGIRQRISRNTLQKIAPTAWENSALAHVKVFANVMKQSLSLQYSNPEINLDHVRHMTTNFGMVQFANTNQPDIGTGYTLDDNARALISICMHFEQTRDSTDIKLMHTYLNFISFCQQPNGKYLNYVDSNMLFTEQNATSNLEDSNGRANWALGYLISNYHILPHELTEKAESIFTRAIQHAADMYSTRAMAFNIKGLYYYNLKYNAISIKATMSILADRLAAMYNHESDKDWKWFESYLTYANSIIPEAMLMAWQNIKDDRYKHIAIESFEFLLSKTFSKSGIKAISNKSWLQKNGESEEYGEQPIDVAYTIIALQTFYSVFNDETFLNIARSSFQWFLGKNHLSQIMYNPCTGGCYDGLEETQINLNQGAESTLSYLISRLIIEKHQNASLPHHLCMRNTATIANKSTQEYKAKAIPLIGM